MAEDRTNITDLNQLKNWFKTGLKPTQAQFWAWMESYWHKDEEIPQDKIKGLSESLENKAETSAVEAKANADASELSDDNILKWKEVLNVGELPTNIATIDEDEKQGNVYTKTKVDELLENSGKNIGNTDLKIPNGERRILDIMGADIAFKGLKSAQGDASFNKRLKLKADGTLGQVDENFIIKEDIMKTATLLNDREKEIWKAEMNGGWTTNTMSVLLISPMVMKNKDEWQFVSLTGVNLNFKPTNFKIEICSGDSTARQTNVVATIDNSKVQLINGQTLGFWLNVVESNLSDGEYKIRLSNGVATYLTPMVFKVLEPSQVKPLVFTNSQGVLLQSGSSTLQMVNSAKDVVLSPDENIKPLASVNGKDIIAQFQTDRVLKGSENWYFELVVNTQRIENAGVTSSYFGLSSSDSISIINTLDFEFQIGKSHWNGPSFTRGLGIDIGTTNPTLRFLKHQNLLTIVISSPDGRYHSVVNKSINTDADYRVVFSKNNCSTVNDKTGFFVTNEYKF